MHEPFDDTTKAFYRRLFEGWGITVESEREIFFRGRAIDLVVRCTDTDRRRLRDTIFAHFRWLNALELKGATDPLMLEDYNRIMMRAWGLGALGPSETSNEQPVSEESRPLADQLPNQRTVTIVCVNRPQRILDELHEALRFFPTTESGIYLCNERLPQWIIYPTELALAPKNYPMLPLAKGEKLAQFIDVCVREGLTDYLQLVMDVGFATDPVIIWQKILEVKQMRPQLPEETWQVIEEFFRLSPEAPEKLPYIQRVFAEGEQRGQQLGERRGEQHARQQTLIRLLQRKFAVVPEETIRQIEATEDIEQLDRWLDLVLDADTLAEIGITPEASLSGGNHEQ